jgi:ABC-type uncharacterized transport system involved in gliding motility auxiliary subunit
MQIKRKKNPRQSAFISGSSLCVLCVLCGKPASARQEPRPTFCALSLRFRHLTPALSPIEAERENYRQSVGEFVTIRVIRVKDFASFWGWIESV